MTQSSDTVQWVQVYSPGGVSNIKDPGTGATYRLFYELDAAVLSGEGQTVAIEYKGHCVYKFCGTFPALWRGNARKSDEIEILEV